MTRRAYLDTSFLCALAFGEAPSKELGERLTGFEEIFSSNLLEAEFRAALLREQRSMEEAEAWLGLLEWILPPRPLSQEVATILETGYSKGSDLWHLACALSAFPKPQGITFATLDRRQWDLAKRLGFDMLPETWTEVDD